MPLNAQLRYQARAQSKTRNLPTTRELFQGHTSHTPTTSLKRHNIRAWNSDQSSERRGDVPWPGHVRDISVTSRSSFLVRVSKHYAWIPEGRSTTIVFAFVVGQLLQQCYRIGYDVASGDRVRRTNDYYVRGQVPMEPYVRMFLAGAYDAVRGWERLVSMSYVPKWSLHSLEVAAALSTYVLGAAVFMPLVQLNALREVTAGAKGARRTEWLPIWGWSQPLLRGTGFPLFCYVIAQLPKPFEDADDPDELGQWTGAGAMFLVPREMMKFDKDGDVDGEVYEGFIARESDARRLGNMCSFIEGLQKGEPRLLSLKQ